MLSWPKSGETRKPVPRIGTVSKPIYPFTGFVGKSSIRTPDPETNTETLFSKDFDMDPTIRDQDT